MPLSKAQVTALLTFVADTNDEEITCGECFDGMADFADKQLVGASLDEALERVEAHIAFCPECSEEYAVLRDMLAAQK